MNVIQNCPTQFGKTALVELFQLLSTSHYSSIWVLVDENTENHCLPILQAALPKIAIHKISIPAGESYKNIDSCQYIWKELLHGNANRKSLLLNLGGGVIGDMGGFCAATYKRGIDFIQIPTTLLSQVDASVGGKLGIDFAQVKNAIGLFLQPKSVIIYPPFLKTLPERELYSGFAEIIKHALIANIQYWNRLQVIKNLNDPTLNWNELLTHSIGIKQQIVETDPLEKGLRKILNFGHTVGHAIESLSWETASPLLHGEAVAIGIICEAFLSVKLLGLSESELQSITHYIFSLYPSYKLSSLDKTALLNLMYQDKKNEATEISFSLLSAIGKAEWNIKADEKLILESLKYYTYCSSLI